MKGENHTAVGDGGTSQKLTHDRIKRDVLSVIKGVPFRDWWVKISVLADDYYYMGLSTLYGAPVGYIEKDKIALRWRSPWRLHIEETIVKLENIT